MKLFQSFSEFLLEVSGVQREQLECFADHCQLIPSGSDLGNCIELGQLKYDGVFEVEHYKGDAVLLLAQIISWLADNDPYRIDLNLADPVVEASPVDRNVVNLDISISFEEPLIVAPAEDGPIKWNGKRWAVSELLIDTAEELIDMDGESND